jgi:hypothetical protein
LPAFQHAATQTMSDPGPYTRHEIYKGKLYFTALDTNIGKTLRPKRKSVLWQGTKSTGIELNCHIYSILLTILRFIDKNQV